MLYVDEGDVLTSAGVAAGIDLCLHLVRRDHGAEVANAVARRIVVAPHRDGGQAQFVERPLPAAGDRGLAATRAWALERLREPLTVAAMARHAALQRAHLRPPLPRRDRHHAAAVAARASASCTRAGCWRRPTSPVEDVAGDAGLRHRGLAALALPPRDGDHAARVSPQLQG